MRSTRSNLYQPGFGVFLLFRGIVDASGGIDKYWEWEVGRGWDPLLRVADDLEIWGLRAAFLEVR